MTVKQNTYSSPVDNISFLDNFIFILKLIVFVSFSILLIIATVLLGKIIPIFGKWLPVIFHKLLIWLLSVRIELEGEINKSNDCNLYISNHLSYLDIPILGSIYPVRFVAKSEVENWPLFGFLAKLGRTIFISRNKFDSLYHCLCYQRPQLKLLQANDIDQLFCLVSTDKPPLVQPEPLSLIRLKILWR